MKNFLLTILVIALGSIPTLHAQVGVGTDAPNKSSQLDVVSSDKGVLIPRVALNSTTDKITIKGGNINSLLVFNTNTKEDITPGYYYWYVDKWFKMAATADIFEDIITTLIKQEDGTFVYTSENSTQTIIDIPAEVLQNILNEGSIYNEIVDLIKINETVTSIVNNEDGTYTYTNELGIDFIIDIPASIVENFETIINEGPVTVGGDTFNTIEEYITHLANSSVSIDGSDFVTVTGDGTSADPYKVSIKEGPVYSMLVTNTVGELEWVAIKDLVKFNETITSIVNNEDGTYTYTNELGIDFIIDIPTSVVENFETIIHEGPITINGDTFNTIEEYITHLANSSVSIGGSDFVTVTGDGTSADPYKVSIKEGPVYSMLVTNTVGELEWVAIKDLVKFNETITSIVNNEDGTYTYKNEAGVEFIIDIPASIVENFETIINEGPVTVGGDTFNNIEEYITHLANSSVSIGGSDFVTVTGDGTSADPYIVSIKEGPVYSMLVTNFTGELEWVAIKDLVKFNETITSIVNNEDGTYTYKNEAGVEFIIDIPASIVENFETIINEGPVTVGGDTFNNIEEYITHLANSSVSIGGSDFVTVTGDGTSANPYIVSIKEGPVYSMLVTNFTGELEWVAIKDLVKFNETITSIVNNEDGTYTYTNELGIDFIIDIPASVVENFETIIHEGPITINGDTFNNIEEYITHLANSSVSIGGSDFVTVTGDGTSADPYIVSIKEGPIYSMLVTNFTGELEWVAIKDLVKFNETITSIVNNEDGTYAYKNEAGVEFIIDIPASIVENFETIINEGPITINGDTFNTIEEYITHLANSSVSIGGSDFVTVSGDGTSADPYIVSIKEGPVYSMLVTNFAGELEWVAIKDLVKFNETITSIENKEDGTYTYTNEAGVEFIIDIPASIVENFETIINEGPITINGDTFNTIEEYITHLANSSVSIGGSDFVTVSGDGTSTDPYIVSIKEGASDSMLVTNFAGELEWVAIKDLVKFNETITSIENKEDGTYTYTNEAGVEFIIDIPASIVENFETIINEGPITINGDTFNTIEEYITHLANSSVSIGGSDFVTVSGDGTSTDPYIVSIKEGASDSMLVTNFAGELEWVAIKDLVKFNETITSIENKEDGTYTYTNELGVEFIIDIPASVVENFETIINEGPITINGDTFNNIEEYITHLANSSVSIGGSDFVTVSGDGTSAGPYIVSIKEGPVYSMLVTNFTGELEWVAIKDLVKFNETVTVLSYDKLKNQLSYTDEKGFSQIIDLGVGSISYNKIDNSITYMDAAGIPTVLILNETSLVYNETSNTLTYTNSKGVSQIINVKDIVNANIPKGDLFLEADVLEFFNGTNGTEKLLAKAEIGIKDAGITTKKLADKAVTSEKLDAGPGEEGRVGVADVNGKIIYKKIGVNNIETRNFTAANDGDANNPSTNSTIEVLTGGENAVLVETSIRVKAESITTEHIKNATIKPEDMASAGNNKVLTTDEQGKVIWVDKSEVGEVLTARNGLTKDASKLEIKLGGVLTEPTLIATDATNTLAITGLGTGVVTDKFVVVDKDSGVLKQITQAPRFFYMPAVIFDTETMGAASRSLYKDYYSQFSGYSHHIANGAAGDSMWYDGGLIGSTGAPATIPVYEANELYYYISYYDTEVFANLNISEEGLLTYEIIGTATPNSYMNIVFVIK